MKDFLGKDLNIGDDVVFMQPEYRRLLKGKIERFTDKMVVFEAHRIQ